MPRRTGRRNASYNHVSTKFGEPVFVVVVLVVLHCIRLMTGTELGCFNGTAAQPTPLLSLSPHINCLLIVTDQLLYVKHYSKRARVTPKKRVSTNGQSKNVLFRWVVRGGAKPIQNCRVWSTIGARRGYGGTAF